MVDEPERLTFLPPSGVPLVVRDGRGVPADDVDVLKCEKGFTNVFSEREYAMFQAIGAGNILCNTTHETITRRILVYDAHSPMLNKRVSASIELRMTRFTDVDHVHDFGDWRFLGVRSGMHLSDHPDQDIEP